MTSTSETWTLLVYKIPSHPTRLRLKIWRKLQSMGALYLQDAVCLLPSRSDLDENMQYVADSIQEMGGSAHLFAATSLLPEGTRQVKAEFRLQADCRLIEIAGHLEQIQATLDSVKEPGAMEQVEEELKRERVAYLRARRLAYFGNTREDEVDARLDILKRSLDELYRSEK